MARRNAIFITEKDILKRQDGTPWIQFPDFTGERGKPSMVLCITPKMAEKLSDAGFRVKHYIHPTKEDYECDQINIMMSYKNVPPTISKKIDGTRKWVRLDEDTLGDLQKDYITKLECSVVLSKTGGIYMDQGFFVVEPDEFSHYYEEMEEEA